MNQDTQDLNIGRDLHRVSTKAALYTPSASHVLIMDMYKGTDRQIYGLPGGHVDAGEVPDDTIVRELHEELGIAATGLRHVDFFIHENGKIVLAYAGTLELQTELRPSEPEKETGAWFTRDEFEALTIESHYRDLILSNWPAS